MLVPPIRVAQVVGKMVGGGMEAVVMNYYRHIDKGRIQFDFIVDSDSTQVPADEIESLGGRVIEVPPYQHQLANSLELENLFRQERWPIVHSHMNSLSVFPLRAAKRAGVPVRIAHSHSTWGKGEWKRNMIKAILRTQANRYPTHKMACGNLAGDWLFGKGADYVVLSNAIDAARFSFSKAKRDCVRNELELGETTFVVGHLGRFVTQKNHSKLIEVFSEVNRRVPESVLLLAGEGPLRRSVENQVEKMGLVESVKFLGQRTDSDALYSAFDCLCLPSLYEGFPVVGVEAQMSGLPIVMSSAISKETQLTTKCVSMPLRASNALWASGVVSSRSIERVIDDRDRKALASYDIRIAAPRLVMLYEQSLKESTV